MAYITTKRYSVVSYLQYNIEECNNRESTFRWFAETIINKIDNILHIELSDLESYHDGSQTEQFTSISDVESFVAKGLSQPFRKISVSFYYQSIHMVLKINLSDYIISLGCSKEDEHVAQSLAETLKLV